jgi:drug/metabolite transporter (DMT)-like permease
MRVESGAVSVFEDRTAVMTEMSLILAALFWGTNYAATKFAALSLPHLYRGDPLRPGRDLDVRLPSPPQNRREAHPQGSALHGGVGSLGVITAQTCFTFGMSMTTAANTGLIFATAPVWGLALGALIGFEKPTFRGIVGVCLSIVVVAAVFWNGLTGAGRDLVGDLLVLVAALGVGTYTVLSMPLLEAHSPGTVATYPILFGLPLGPVGSPAGSRASAFVA